MNVVYGLEEFSNKTVVALGNFDGVHIGHQKLINEAIADAKDRGIPSLVMVFDPHPMKVLVPAKAPKLLTTNRTKAAILADMGLDNLILAPFDMEIAGWSPEHFVKKVLIETLKARSVYVGYNYTFGSRASGDAEMLVELGDKYGFSVKVIPPVMYDNKVVSSSLVRKFMEAGDIPMVKILTGRFPALDGVVIQGEKRGRSLGYPTANLTIDSDLITPGSGVYAATVRVLNNTYGAVVNIGHKPTFHDNYPIAIEAHIFDFDDDIYNQDIMVTLIEKLRGEIKFAALDDLIQQIKTDSFQARAVLSREARE